MATPTPIQHISGSYTDSNITVGGTYNIPLPNPVLSGNCLICTVSFDNTNGSTVVVTDDLGSTWVTGPSVVDGTPHFVTTAIFYALNCAAGANVIHIQINTATTIAMHGTITEFNNIATSAASDGSTSNQGTSTTTVAAGSFTPTTSGDLIFQVASTSSTTTSYTQGSSPWVALSLDVLDDLAVQYQIQPTAGAINPTLTVAPAVNFRTVAIALKSAAAGTAAPAGIRIVRLVHCNTKNETASSVVIQFPCNTGNLLVVSMSAGKGYEISSGSDNLSNTYIPIGLQAGADPNVQLYYVKGLTVGQNLTTTWTMTGSSTGHGATFMYYEIAGADPTNPLDTGFGTSGFASGSGNQPTGTSGDVTGFTATPSGPNELIIVTGGQAWDSATGWSSPSGATFIPTSYSGEPNPTHCDENNAAGIYYNGASVSAQTWTMTHDAINFPGIGDWVMAGAAFMPPTVGVTGWCSRISGPSWAI